jgi:hypothetical protein
VDDAVLQALGGDVLRPAMVSAIIDGVLAALVAANVDTRVEELRQQLRVLDSKIQHLTVAVEQGGATLPSIIARLSERQQERDALVAAFSQANTLKQIQVDRAAIEHTVQQQVANWRGLLRGSWRTRGNCCVKCWKRRSGNHPTDRDRGLVLVEALRNRLVSRHLRQSRHATRMWPRRSHDVRAVA